MNSTSPEASANTSHTSVVRNNTTEKIISSGTARVRSVSEETSWERKRPIAQWTIATSPYPTTP
jgi:hypothetical protein